jgi:hypothetical protein
MQTDGPGSQVEVVSDADAVIVRGSSGLGFYGYYSSLMIVVFGLGVLSLWLGFHDHSGLAVLFSVGMFIVSGVFFSHYQKFEFQFRIPEKCLYWKRSGLFGKKSGRVEFMHLQGIQQKNYSNPGNDYSAFGDPMATAPSGYPVPTAGIYLLVDGSSMAIIPGGMKIEQARRHMATLKTKLPMFAFSEIGSET